MYTIDDEEDTIKKESGESTPIKSGSNPSTGSTGSPQASSGQGESNESEEPEVEEEGEEIEEEAEDNRVQKEEHVDDSEMADEEEDGGEEREEQMDDIRKVGDETENKYYQTSSLYQPQRKKGGKKYLVIFIVLIVLAVIGFIFKHQIKGLFLKAQPTPTPTATPVPTPTPNPLIRSDWSLEVLNGTTTAGQAKKLTDKLKELGYPIVKTGNADKQNYQTSQILVKKDLLAKVDLVVADLKDTIKIASVAGELKEGTASARIIIGQDY